MTVFRRDVEPAPYICTCSTPFRKCEKPTHAFGKRGFIRLSDLVVDEDRLPGKMTETGMES